MSRWRRPSGDPEDVDYDKVEAAGLRILAPRDHTVFELRTKLKQRRFPQEHIDAVVERFGELGYLDDQRVTAIFVRQLIRKGWGPLMVRQKIRKRGGDPMVLAGKLDAIDDDQWIATARELVETKYGDRTKLDDAGRQRAFKLLRRRGYPAALSRAVLFD